MRPDSRAWKSAKSAGDAAELAAAAWFQQRGGSVLKTIGQAGYDLRVEFRLEVKNDLSAAHTGNVAFETKYAGRDSGIVTTPAQWWAIVVRSEMFIVRTDRLRPFITDGKWREVSAGDGGKARCRLVPIEGLRELAGPGGVVRLGEVTP